MSSSEGSPSSVKKVLIITSSGGGGLLQTANAKEQEILAKYPSAIVIQRDVMKDWMWKGLGKFFVGQWNRAQHRGDVKAQVFFGAAAPIIEYFFWPHIFFCSLYTIFKRDIDQVIDTQIMGTSAIIKALRIFHKRRNKKVQLEKVLVDLPTPKATHFFQTIKKLSSKDKRFFKLITIQPLLESGETASDFWKRHCNLTANELQYEDYYVRQAFRKFKREKQREPLVLKTHFQNGEEEKLILSCLQRSSISFRRGAGYFEFDIPVKDRVFMVLLGSQPAQEGTLKYVKGFIDLAKEKKSEHLAAHLFVFCANHAPQTQSLMKKVVDSVLQEKEYPSHFTVIPMSFQPDTILAPLFNRCDITCTRSGGQTAMELMSVGTGNIWVHSEAKKQGQELSEEELLAGIPCWESANAVYMQRMVGAKIVTPDTFVAEARKVIEGNISQ